MNTQSSASAVVPPAPATAEAAPRFDRKFIDDQQIVERYLTNKLPLKGARELENWCRSHPEFLDELKLSERTHASLKLLDLSGRPEDLREAPPPWWKTLYFLIGLGVLAFVCLIAFWVLFGKYVLLRGELADTRTQMAQGPLAPATTLTSAAIAPDRAPGLDKSKLTVSRSSPTLVDVRIDMSYSRQMQFRLTVDKKDQGRALVLNNLLKDSNGDLRLSFNTSGLGAGIYTVRIESLPFSGSPIAEGWLILDVH
jgi:hypothetical protein